MSNVTYVIATALIRVLLFVVVFFFQAEDGIRYWSVTGVQTCALPICGSRLALRSWSRVETRAYPYNGISLSYFGNKIRQNKPTRFQCQLSLPKLVIFEKLVGWRAAEIYKGRAFHGREGDTLDSIRRTLTTALGTMLFFNVGGAQERIQRVQLPPSSAPRALSTATPLLLQARQSASRGSMPPNSEQRVARTPAVR